MSDAENPEPTGSSDMVRRGGIGCLALIAVFAGVAMCSASNEDDGPSQTDLEYGARDVCETFVERRLKSPSTADFSDTTTAASGESEWTVSGAVDSQNGFGAMIRNNYTCVVRPKDVAGDNWTLVSMSGLGN